LQDLPQRRGLFRWQCFHFDSRKQKDRLAAVSPKFNQVFCLSCDSRRFLLSAPAEQAHHAEASELFAYQHSERLSE
jgi:hypothetical protein